MDRSHVLRLPYRERLIQHYPRIHRDLVVVGYRTPMIALIPGYVDTSEVTIPESVVLLPCKLGELLVPEFRTLDYPHIVPGVAGGSGPRESASVPEFARLRTDLRVADNVSPILVRVEIQKLGPAGMEFRIYVLELRITDSVAQAAEVSLPLLRGIAEDQRPSVDVDCYLYGLAVTEDRIDLRVEFVDEVPYTVFYEFEIVLELVDIDLLLLSRTSQGP